MSGQIELLKAWVTLQARGQSEVEQTVGKVSAQLGQLKGVNDKIDILASYAKTRGLKLAAEDAAKLLDVASRGGGGLTGIDRWIDQQKAAQAVAKQSAEAAERHKAADGLHGAEKHIAPLKASLDAAANRQKNLAPVLDYAKSRGLNVAAEDAGKLAAQLARAGNLAGFDKWLDGQAKAARSTKTMIEGMQDFSRFAQTGFATATGLVTGFAQAASPAHWQTLTGSINLVSMAIGEHFLPYVEMAIDFIQDVAFAIKNADPELKAMITKWTMIGGAALGVVVILPRVLGMLQMVAGGFIGLGKAIGAAASLLKAFALASPIGMVLALVAAVAALMFALKGLEGVANSRVTRQQTANERLRAGGPLEHGDVEAALHPEERRRLAATRPGSPEYRAELRRIQAGAEQQMGAQGTPEQREDQAGRAQQALERTRDQSGLSSWMHDRFSFIPNVGAHGHSERAQTRLEALRQAGVSPQSIQQMWQSGQMGAVNLSSEQIAGMAGRVRGGNQEAELRARVAAAGLRDGNLPAAGSAAAGRPRQTASGFQSHIGSIESARANMLQAAASGGSLEQTTRDWQNRLLATLSGNERGVLTEIRDRLPGDGPRDRAATVGGQF